MVRIIKLIFLISYFFLNINSFGQSKRYFYPNEIISNESGVMFYDSIGDTHFICEYHNCVFKDNTINGVLCWYDKKNKIISSQTLVNGIRNGLTVEYYDSSKIFRIMNFVNDDLEGLYEEFYISGLLRKKYNWYKNNYEGEYIYLRENSDTLVYAQYKQGEIHGDYISFRSNGKRRFHLVQINGKMISLIQYNRNGNVKKEKRNLKYMLSKRIRKSSPFDIPDIKTK